MSEATTHDDLTVARRLLADLRVRHDAVCGLLTEHQELSRLQGNRIDELTAELGGTQAKLRAAQAEIQRLTTLLNGYSGRPRT